MLNNTTNSDFVCSLPVQIIHAEADAASREKVIRPLAQGLEKNLKLPGQADCDYLESKKPWGGKSCFKDAQLFMGKIMGKSCILQKCL